MYPKHIMMDETFCFQIQTRALVSGPVKGSCFPPAFGGQCSGDFFKLGNCHNYRWIMVQGGLFLKPIFVGRCFLQFMVRKPLFTPCLYFWRLIFPPYIILSFYFTNFH